MKFSSKGQILSVTKDFLGNIEQVYLVILSTNVHNYASISRFSC